MVALGELSVVDYPCMVVLGELPGVAHPRMLALGELSEARPNIFHPVSKLRPMAHELFDVEGSQQIFKTIS